MFGDNTFRANISARFGVTRACNCYRWVYFHQIDVIHVFQTEIDDWMVESIQLKEPLS